MVSYACVLYLMYAIETMDKYIGALAFELERSVPNDENDRIDDSHGWDVAITVCHTYVG